MCNDNIYSKLSTMIEDLKKELSWYAQNVPSHKPTFRNTPELISVLKEIHGDKYDYRNIVWDGKLESKITVTCKKHGTFSKKVSALTSVYYKTGNVIQCPECAKDKRRKESLLAGAERIFEAYGDTYEIGEFVGERLLTSKANILCTKHKTSNICRFDLIPKHSPCPSCQGVVATKDDFISALSERVKERLCFDLMEFVDRATPIKVKCRKHDTVYKIKPYLLYGGSLRTKTDSLGCPDCKTECRNTSFNDFYECAIGVHGDKFVYDQSSFKGLTHKGFTITCKRHGNQFDTSPNLHINTKYGGCSVCEDETRGDARRKTLEEFIRQSRETHGARYSYDKVVYKSGSDKVTITCPDHGDFEQRPNDHIKSDGCTVCGSYSFWGTKIDTTSEASLYLMLLESHDESFIKIGVSKNPENRAKQIECDTRGHYRVQLISHIRGNANEVHNTENYTHKILKDKKYNPKVKFGGYTECFEHDEISWLSDVFFYCE